MVRFRRIRRDEQMASIVKRGKTYCVVYTYLNKKGERKQKWESFKTKAEAEIRQRAIEIKKSRDELTIAPCSTVADLVKEYIELYGKNQWALSTYTSNVALFDNYILPKLGSLKLTDVTSRVIEQYYRSLLEMDRIPPKRYGKPMKQAHPQKVSPNLIREIHKLLSSCFKQGVRWELIDKNPCQNATRPKVEKNERDIWTLEDLQRALDVCDDDRLKLAINLAFSCTLRIGEMVGLTWDCVEIGEEAMNAGRPYIHITKELQRVDRKTLELLDRKDVIQEFPVSDKRNKSVMVLKAPKTRTSIRKVYLPISVAKMLIDWRKQQEEIKSMLGTEYTDYGLVFTGPFGGPVEGGSISDAFQRLIRKNNLPPVVFHSLRHSSITYKLKLNGGDIKAVQGDSGHAQATMVTEQYSHILASGQQSNADLIERYFYGKEPLPQRMGKGDDDMDKASSMKFLMKLLADPETAALLKAFLSDK